MSKEEDNSNAIDPSWDNLPGETVLCLNGVSHDSDYAVFIDNIETRSDMLIEKE